MRKPKSGPAAQIEVDDPAAAMQRFQDFTRKILAVPRKDIERKMATEKKKKQHR
jgi:hypothetical protein